MLQYVRSYQLLDIISYNDLLRSMPTALSGILMPDNEAMES